MNGSHHQTLVVGVIVLGALAYLGWRLWRKVRGRTGCGCEHCPVHDRQRSKSAGTG